MQKTHLPSLFYLLFFTFCSFSTVLAQSDSTDKKFEINSRVLTGYNNLFEASSDSSVIPVRIDYGQEVYYSITNKYQLGISFGVSYSAYTSDDFRFVEIQTPLLLTSKVDLFPGKNFVDYFRLDIGFAPMVLGKEKMNDDAEWVDYEFTSERIPMTTSLGVGFDVFNKSKKSIVRFELGYQYRKLAQVRNYSGASIYFAFLIGLNG
tara:strand:+ start:1882 stop:2499 length:618 start_codon:yes stop_codon:yes gene_type:complete